MDLHEIERFSEQELERVKATFKKKLILQWTVIGFLLIPVILLIISSGYPEQISSTIVTYLLAIIAIITFVFSLKNWRCPSCQHYFGQSLPGKYCKHCGVELK